MTPDLYWDGLFEVIERTLNPTRKRTPATPSKRLAKSKPKSKIKAKAKAKLRTRRKSKQKTAAEAKKPRAKAAKFVAKTHRPGRAVRASPRRR